jgi:hypothetical protein
VSVGRYDNFYYKEYLFKKCNFYLLKTIKLDFETAIDMPFDLPARTSIIVVLKATKRNITATRKARELSPCSLTITITFYYYCSERVRKSISILLASDDCGFSSNFGNSPSSNSILINEFFGSSSSSGIQTSHLSIWNFLRDCNESSGNGGEGLDCPIEIIKCSTSFIHNILSMSDCYSAIYESASCLAEFFTSSSGTEQRYNEVTDCILFNMAMPAFLCAAEIFLPHYRLLKMLKNTIATFHDSVNCAVDISLKCIKPFFSRPKRSTGELININSPFLYKNDLAPVLAEAIIAFLNLKELFVEVYSDGDELVDSMTIELIKQFLASSSEAGKYISASEYKKLESATITGWLKHFIERLNNTMILIDSPSGTNSKNYMNLTLIKQKHAKYKSDSKLANFYGFQSILEWLKYTAIAYDKAPIRKGVCARVTIRLSQQLVLTREIFEAELQMLNTEAVDLININISLSIRRANDSVIVDSSYFHVSEPALTLFSSIDGYGTLKAGDRGQVKWLLTPSKLAAPIYPIDYVVDGFVKYKLNSANLKIEISPEKITVKPDPSLVLIYFLEKYVQSDDPLTSRIEPTIPFALGLLIINNGYGVARNLRIQTSKPEIIENKSGLLIDFKIISFYLNDMLDASTLNIFFGDVAPFEVKHGIWLMESSLKGTFSRLNATLVNEDRNGEKQLSLIDRIEYKQLIKTVRLYGKSENEDDGLVDFLTLENTRYKVYPSNAPLEPFDVIYISNGTIVDVDLVKNSMNFRLELFTSCWFLAQVKLSGDSSSLNEVYILDTKQNGNKLLPRENVWINQLDEENTWILSIFDIMVIIKDQQLNTTRH